MNLDYKGILTVCVDYVKNNPLIFAPQILLGVISFVMALLLIGGAVGMGSFSGSAEAAVGSILVALMIFLLVMVIASFITLGWTAAMAGEVVETGYTSLGGGFSRFTGNIGPIFIVLLLSGLIIGIGMVLCVLPGIVAGFFLMFSLPAVVYAGIGGVEALKESFELVKENLVDCVVLAAIAMGLGIVAYILSTIISVVTGIIPVIGIVGGLIGGIIQAAVGTFILVMIFEVYKELTGGAEVAAEPQPVA